MCVCVMWECVSERRSGRRRRRRKERCSTKNKNPTRQCGEIYIYIILKLNRSYMDQHGSTKSYHWCSKHSKHIQPCSFLRIHVAIETWPVRKDADSHCFFVFVRWVCTFKLQNDLVPSKDQNAQFIWKSRFALPAVLAPNQVVMEPPVTWVWP